MAAGHGMLCAAGMEFGAQSYHRASIPTLAEVRSMLRRLSGVFLVASTTVLTACGNDDNLTGIITTPQPFLGCQTVQSLSLNTTISGSLTSSDCQVQGFFVDFYEVSLTAPRVLTIVMTSTQVDAFLELYDRGTGTLLAEDDDSAGGPNDSNARLDINLAAGTYVIAATSFFENEIGTYQLSVN